MNSIAKPQSLLSQAHYSPRNLALPSSHRSPRPVNASDVEKGDQIAILYKPKRPIIRRMGPSRRNEMARINSLDKMTYGELVRAELEVARLKVEKQNKA